MSKKATLAYLALFTLLPFMTCAGLFIPFGETDTARLGVKVAAGVLCLLAALSRKGLSCFTQAMREWQPVIAVLIAVLWSDLLAGTLFLSDVAYAVALAITGTLGGYALKTGGRSVFVSFAVAFQLAAFITAVDYYWGTRMLFDNKAGYAAFILLAIPIWWAAWDTKHKWQASLCYTVLLADIVSLFGTGLRGAWLALTLASLLTWLYYAKPSKIPKKKATFILLSMVVGLAALIYMLYLLRPDSANGRLFIFLCAAKLGMQSPLFGWGTYAILAHYMPVQAEVLAALPADSTAAMLADNTFTAFNLPLDVFARYGLFGLLCAGWVVFSLYSKLSGSTNRLNKSLFFALTAFLVLSLTSYPLSYPVVFALFAVFLGMGCALKQGIRNKAFRIGVLTVGLFLIITAVYTFHKECIWQDGDDAVRKEMALGMKHRPELLYNHAASLNEQEEYASSDSVLQLLPSVLCDYDTELLRGDNALWSGHENDAERHLKEAHRMIPSRFTPLYGLLQLYSDYDVQRADSVALVIQHKRIKIPSQETSRIQSVAADWLRNRTTE